MQNRRLIAAAVALLSPAVARADEPVEVMVIGDKADALQKIPGSGTVIRTPEIDRAQPADVAEMLRRVPGVVARQEPGAGGRPDIGVRGLDPGRSRRVLVLEDGVPVAINPYAEPDLYYAPPIERVRGIEVVKGSGSILFGPQTIGGVINFVTLFPPDRREASAQIRAGELGQFEALGRYGDARGGFRWIAQASFKRGDGFRAESFRTVDLFAKAALATGRNGEATVKLGFYDSLADSDDVGLTRAMFEADPRRTTLAPHDRMTLRRYELAVVHEQRLADWATLRTLAYGYATDRLWRRQDYDRAPVAGVDYERIVGRIGEAAIWFRRGDHLLDRGYQVAGVEPKAELRFATGAVGHTLSFGARVLGEFSQQKVLAGATVASEGDSVERSEFHRTVAFAGYVEDRLAFAGSRVLVTPGVRVEHARYRRAIDRDVTAAGPADVNVAGTNQATGVVPGIGMTAGIPQAHAFGGVHFGFAPPRLATAVSPSGQTIDLASERSIIYEIGGRARYARLFEGEVTGFLSNFDNQIVTATGDAGTELVNGGKTRHFGAETAVATSLAPLIGHGVSLDAALRYTLMRAEFSGGNRDGNDLPYAPHHLVSATLDVGHASGVAAEVAYGFVGGQFSDDLDTVSADPTGRIGRIPAYHTLDLGARYRHARSGLTLLVAAKNVLDRPFIIARRPEGIAAAGFRQVTVALRWDYR